MAKASQIEKEQKLRDEADWKAGFDKMLASNCRDEVDSGVLTPL
jgi:hypothetical protein